MSPERDQTKWRGIMPTNPPETIPVSMAAPPPCAKVEPCAANNFFNTRTRKIAPAISDLQAVKGNVSGYVDAWNQDCRVTIALDAPDVGAGEIYVITHMVMSNDISMCDMIIKVNIDGGFTNVKQFKSYPPDTYGDWNGSLVLEEDDFVSFQWLLGGVLDVVRAYWHGYKIGAY